ncbi:Scr1 family TA system antitoxin-like transcriptional regulator, partial [Streptomyces tendae]
MARRRRVRSRVHARRSRARTLDRQEVLRADPPLELRAVIDESVLHRGIGGPEVMRGQLAALREAAALPHV